MGFELLRPGFSWLPALGALALVLGALGARRSRFELARLIGERGLARFAPGLSPGRRRARLVLGGLGLFLLGVAALGPVRGFTYRPVSRKGLDLVLCLDTSKSMLAQDLRPSRLARAQREVLGLLDHLKGDRVALVAFSGDARDVAPLTRDRATLESLLAFVSPEDNQLGGTDLAAAIEHALALFDGRTGAHEAIVLLTDGEDLEGQGAALAEEALRRKIRIYVVGIGTEEGGKIPVAGADGRPGFLRDSEGHEVITRLDRTSLEALALKTGGAFLSAVESPTPLEDLHRARISRLEGREIQGGERAIPHDRYQWPLALGVLCLLLEAVLRDRRREEKRARAPRLAAGLLPWILLPVPQEESSSYDVSLSNAVRHHEEGEPKAAEAAARSILAQADQLGLTELERARAHYALGVISAVRAAASKPGAEDEQPAQCWQISAEAFAAARALAGPGELRLDATYDLGCLALLQAEDARARIPEVSGAASSAPPLSGQPGSGQAGAPPGAAPAPETDPLEEARALYLEGKTWFLERLRADWRDPDTRANLEWIQRRLHELEEIEKQRQQEEQQGDRDQEQQQGEQQPGDPQEEQQEGEPEEQEDREGEPGQEEQEPGGSQDPGEDEKQEEPPADQPPPPGESQQEQPRTGEEPAGGEEQTPAQAAEPQEGEPAPSERVLTREEVLRLLDKLAELEEQGKKLEALLRAKRRTPTERDW